MKKDYEIMNDLKRVANSKQFYPFAMKTGTGSYRGVVAE